MVFLTYNLTIPTTISKKLAIVNIQDLIYFLKSKTLTPLFEAHRCPTLLAIENIAEDFSIAKKITATTDPTDAYKFLRSKKTLIKNLQGCLISPIS